MTPHRLLLGRPTSARIAGLLVAALLTVAACGGSSGGEQGPVQVTSPIPATAGTAPALGAATVGGITVSGVSLHGSGGGIGVIAQLTSTRTDQLVSIGSNYTRTTVLPPPVPVDPGPPTTLDPSTAVLQPSGPIASGATVSVFFTFAAAGAVEVFGTYTA